jgi:hypothetical protein
LIRVFSQLGQLGKVPHLPMKEFWQKGSEIRTLSLRSEVDLEERKMDESKTTSADINKGGDQPRSVLVRFAAEVAVRLEIVKGPLTTRNSKENWWSRRDLNPRESPENLRFFAPKLFPEAPASVQFAPRGANLFDVDREDSTVLLAVV